MVASLCEHKYKARNLTTAIALEPDNLDSLSDFTSLDEIEKRDMIGTVLCE